MLAPCTTLSFSVHLNILPPAAAGRIKLDGELQFLSVCITGTRTAGIQEGL